MRTPLYWTIAVPILAMTVPASEAADPDAWAGAAESIVDEVIEPGRKVEFLDRDGVLLAPGFWAKSGSEITVASELEFLQLSDQPHVPPPPPDPFDRSPPEWGECPDLSHPPCISGHVDPDMKRVEVDVGRNVRLPNPASYYGIKAIEINEMGNNNPCWLRLWGNILDPRFAQDGRNIRILAEYRLRRCNSATTVDHKIVAYERWTNRFIRGVRVCVDHQAKVDLNPLRGPTGRLEIKGVKVLAGQIASMNEHVAPVSQPKGFMRPNCPDGAAAVDLVGAGPRSGWYVWSTCLDGQLATGMSAWIEEDRAFSALQVKCAYVRLLPGAVPANDEQGY